MKKTLSFFAILSIFFFAYPQNDVTHSTVSPSILTDSVPTGDPEENPPLSKWKEFWKFSGIVGLKVSQTQLVNWAAGGNSNFAGIAYANLTLNYKKHRYAWDTNFDTDFGMLYSSDFLSYRWRKANDKINFSTTFGYVISPEKHTRSIWFVAANGTFKSQYAKGYNYPPDTTRMILSNWLSPSYTELSVGINWKWEELISIYCSPVAGLITSCTDPVLRESYGVPLDKTHYASFGLTFRAGIMYDGVKNLKILTGLQLYTPYTDKEQKFGNFNVDWDVIITYQFLKVLNVSLTTNLKYYHKVLFPEAPLRRVQFQEIFGLGVAYSF
jgi:hypothetical protein